VVPKAVVPAAAVEAVGTGLGSGLGSRRSPTQPRSGSYSKRGVVIWKKSLHR
jgi:hypothetical protein